MVQSLSRHEDVTNFDDIKFDHVMSDPEKHLVH